MPSDNTDKLMAQQTTNRRPSSSKTKRPSSSSRGVPRSHDDNNNSPSSSSSSDDYANNNVLTASSNQNLFPGDKYIARRSSSKRTTSKKDKRSSRRSSRSQHQRTSSSPPRRSNTTTTTSRSKQTSTKAQLNNSFSGFTEDNSYSTSGLEFGGNNNNTGNHTSSTPTRASVSSAYFQDDMPDFASYAESKYIRKPQPPAVEEEEEQHALLQLQSPSQYADPLDPLAGHPQFRDEFEDEMDEIEMSSNHKGRFVSLSDMEAAGIRQRRRRTCACIMVCLGLVGTIAGVAFYFLNKHVNNTDPNLHVAKSIPQQVPKAGTGLHVVCSQDQKNPTSTTDTGFPLSVSKECEMACLKAECCWNHQSVFECTADTQRNCDAYLEPCQVIKQHATEEIPLPNTTLSPNDGDDNKVVVPPPPSTLKTVCVPVGGTATKVCTDMCARADCCWNTSSDMQCTDASKEEHCGVYHEFCWFLNAHNNDNNQAELPFPVAPNDLETTCSTNSLKTDTQPCREACSKASCCWKVGTVNCAADVPNDMCTPYENSCAILNNLNDNAIVGTTIPEAPADLEVDCTPSEMEEMSFQLCQEKCEPAKCCWDTTVDGCPSSVAPATCQPYAKSCSILNDLVGDDSNGYQEAVTSSSSSIIPSAPDDLTERCSQENIVRADNGGKILIECERDCLKAACCWQPNAKDICSDDSKCDAYEKPCSMFVGLFSNSNNNGDSNIDSNVPSPPSDLDDICAPDKLSTSVDNGEFIVKCEKACLKAGCCWKDNHPNKCPDSTQQCQPYMEPCGEHLVAALSEIEGAWGAGGSGTDSSTSSNPTSSPNNGSSSNNNSSNNDNDNKANEISRACNTSFAFFVKARCENLCSSGDCCFDDSIQCESDLNCDIFEPCSVLYRRQLLRH